MSFLKVNGLQVKIGNFILDNISFELNEGQIITILGPSGSGKTILLESIAGFHTLNKGKIYLENKDISILPVEKREIGFMFQDYALFPHWTVRENILSSFKFNKGYKKININPEKIIKMLHIEDLLDRYPINLSGGERQRVALARSLVANPKMFLFDEPMSALDARTRENLRDELLSILKNLSLSAIYVTHDHIEAFTLGDLVGIINKGKLVQIGERNKIFRNPNSIFVADFIGIENLFSAKIQLVKKVSPELYFIIAKHKQIEFKIFSKEQFSTNDEVFLSIRSEDISFLDESEEKNDNFKNIIILEVIDIVQIDFFYKIFLGGDVLLKVITLKDSIKKHKINTGKKIKVHIDPEYIHIIKA
ncbi:iron(III)/molybdate/tungstate transport system ATP-binding protein [Thermodesulfobium acidiphilum]|uniref:Iron(III)/molybdate/tungstate transport system ATP-binding protein n=1 Tax=Thermodesulfobium acidiphilum TaxID=1794699 RepID=A0A2R4W1A1_THEAF|nr:ABC transporter ATP-binding protein [Thermodesulfobium acidiphilum]AWB10593.1 iron(III)/molybdate/tungstate transport system ATP-binding protein [Thermodesulfobium acidiphilum]PMP85426.1 MAG: sulfate ABC transporter ATP-binding protein [Thermodesulfobium narugense]